MLKTTQAKFVVGIVTFFLVLMLVTVLVIQFFVAPQLELSERQLVRYEINERASAITEQMHRVQAQVRSITQSVSVMDSDDIDNLLPALVDQYKDINVFGGGVWPLPNQRMQGRDKFSTFYARDASGELQKNIYWNSEEADNYYEQVWYQDGMQAPPGYCAWANAYQDDASIEPRTNCAMAIAKEGEPYGVATIDVTLGFFNHLALQMGDAIGGRVLIIEADGTVVGNADQINTDADLMNTQHLGGSLPMAEAINDLFPFADSDELLEKTYSAEGEAHTLLVQSIPDTPWFLAAGLPTSLLTQQTDSILTRLGLVQVPLAVVFLVVLLLFVRTLMSRLEKLNASIRSLSAGGADLTQRLPDSNSPEFNSIQQSFNMFIEHLQTLMRQVGDSSISISSASSQIASGNIDLSARTEEQASSIAETAATMEQLTEGVKQSAVNATEANRMADEASHMAREGSTVVGDVIQTMGSIQQTSNRVAEIISVIDGISFQTNLLALNAAVEAARAGEHGRGFAVVATEVRVLAQRSADAAMEIKSLIEASVSQVDDGAKLVNQAGVTMNELLKGVSDVSVLMGEIMSASHEQSMGIEQINKAVNQLDSVTQQNASLVEQVSSAANSMNDQTKQLEQVVSNFRL